MKKIAKKHFSENLLYFSNRKPFHPKRLNELMLAPFFSDPIELEEEEDINELTEDANLMRSQAITLQRNMW